jgi:hypothetical protein
MAYEEDRGGKFRSAGGQMFATSVGIVSACSDEGAPRLAIEWAAGVGAWQ